MKVFEYDLDFIPEYNIRSICSPEEMLLFDIETTGLKKETTQLYLIGCAYYKDEVWKLRQWLTESTSDEEEVISDFLDFASSFKTLVHFNGDGFDIPYIRYKAEYYYLGDGIDRAASFDIYKTSRIARKLLDMKSMSQRSVEEFLGIEREDQMNGGLLIPVYYEYEKNRSNELERLLLLHNYDDIQGMIKILPILSYADLLNGCFHFSSAQQCQGTQILEYRLSTPVPVKCEMYCSVGYTNDDIQIFAQDDLLQINIKIYKDTGLIPLENISDYYYLPDEDIVIHKDVAQFMDRSRREKATRKNCFLKKKGQFIPQPLHRFEPCYYFGNDRKRMYVDLDSFKSSSKAGGQSLSEGSSMTETELSAAYETLAKDILQMVSCK